MNGKINKKKLKKTMAQFNILRTTSTYVDKPSIGYDAIFDEGGKFYKMDSNGVVTPLVESSPNGFHGLAFGPNRPINQSFNGNRLDNYSYNAHYPNKINLSQFVPIKDIVVSSLDLNCYLSAAYAPPGGNGGYGKILVYDDDNGTPNNLLVESPSLLITDGVCKYTGNYTFKQGIVYWVGSWYSASPVMSYLESNLQPYIAIGDFNMNSGESGQTYVAIQISITYSSNAPTTIGLLPTAYLARNSASLPEIRFNY